MHPLGTLDTYLHPLQVFGVVMLIAGGVLLTGYSAGVIVAGGFVFNAGLWGYYALLGLVLAVLGAGLWVVGNRDVSLRATPPRNA